MNYSIRFYPEKRASIVENVPVMLSVTYAGKRMNYYTGKRCDIDQWDIAKNKLKVNQSFPDGTSSMEFNRELKTIIDAIDELFKDYTYANVFPEPGQLRNELKLKLGKTVKVNEVDETGFFERFDQYIKNSDLSDNRQITLNSILKKLKAHNPNTTFETLDLLKFQSYLINDNKLSINTASLFLNGLRAFIKNSNLKGYTSINPFSTFTPQPEKYGNPVYITTEERDLIFNAALLDKNLSLTRDIFVFACMTGARFGDLMTLRQDNIINGAVHYIAAKTRDDSQRVARIPLTDKAKQILSRYNLPDGRLLPKITVSQFNIFLKILFHFVGIERMVSIPDKKTRQSIQISIADMASSHMARRCFIGGLYKKNVKDSIIASMSGHCENSKAFSRYYQIDQEDQKQAINLIE